MTKEGIPVVNKEKIKRISILTDAEEWYEELRNIGIDIIYYLQINRNDLFSSPEKFNEITSKILNEIDRVLKGYNYPCEIEAILGIALLRRYIFFNCPKVDKQLYKELLEEFKKNLTSDFRELMESVNYNSTALYLSLTTKYFSRFLW